MTRQSPVLLEVSFPEEQFLVASFAVISGYLKTREPVDRTEQWLLQVLFAEAEPVLSSHLQLSYLSSAFSSHR